MTRGLALVLLVVGCGDNLEGEDRQGGDTTVDDRTAQAFTHPASNLTEAQVDIWRAGRGPFDFRWVPPQLGPSFNNAACAGCHGNRGRGLSQLGRDSIGSQALVRVSLTNGTPAVPGGSVPVPGYGLQLHDHTTSGLPEIFATVTWRDHADSFADGTIITLRSPFVDITFNNGAPTEPPMMSYRQAPPIIGLGLLDSIAAATIEALADPDDTDGDGISGRANHVWSAELGTTALGRFGWKANTASLREQVAGAFVNDMGLTSLVFPEPDGMRDVSDEQLEQAAFFTSALAVPRAAPRSDAAWRGRSLFDDFQCSSCHVPTLVTGDSANPAFAHQRIHPYTDLLVHDMGDLLADARPDFEADGREWRTPPLWGIGLTNIVQDGATFLHDGRARTLVEAILWHGGEADGAREAFRHATASDRDALIAFLMTL